jgi:uncharacterized delta-60 repeat protein
MIPRIRNLLASALATCLLVAAVAAGSAAGSVTESLGVHYVRTEFAGLTARADGGIVALRGKQVESYLADGTPDPHGASVNAPPEGRLYPAAGGKTFVLGYQKLTRLNADGSVDTSFGEGGSIVPPSGARAVYELGSGEIVVVATEVGGTHIIYANVDIELLNQDGSKVSGSVDSRRIPAVNAYGSIPVAEIGPTNDGGALVVGDGFLLELNADGSIDKSFGDEGLTAEVSNQIGGHVLPDGSIETVGSELSGHRQGPTLRRFTAAGQPDTTFGPKGMRHFDLGESDEALVVSWGADGSAIVGGHSELHRCPREECEEAPVLFAFNPAGELETGFGQGGILRLSSLAGLPDGSRSQGVSAIVRRPDGSIVAAGNAPPDGTTGFLAALSPQGALLPGFGESGIVIVRQTVPAEEEVAGLEPLPDGKVLAVGNTDVGVGSHPILIRYTAADRLDRSFGGGKGYVVLRKTRGAGNHDATGFALQGDKVLTGVYDIPRSHLVMARTSGSPVTSFGAGGTIELPHEAWALQTAFAGDGDPLVLARRRVAAQSSATPTLVLRYRPDGSPEKSFGRGGRFATELPGGQVVWGKSLLTLPGGRILVGGSVGHRFALAELLPDGKLDRHFGAGGWSIFKCATLTHNLTLRRVGSQIYLAGAVGDERGKSQIVLMRFDRDGRLDRSFGRHGRIVDTAFSSAGPTAIVPTRKGVLVVLSGGPKPLLTFTNGGKIRRRSIDAGSRYVHDVRAVVSKGHLILGWAAYDYALGRKVFHLTRRPLGG